MDDIDTFEYPSFEVAMAELGSTGSDDDNNNNIEEEDDPSMTTSTDDHHQKNPMNGKSNGRSAEFNHHPMDDVDDDELERLARINAEFNTNNLAEKPLKPKGKDTNQSNSLIEFFSFSLGTLHTFRPTHLDQYELGTQHGSSPFFQSSDISTVPNSYTILARQKLLVASDNSKNSIFKQQKSTYENIQWSSMSTTTDLLF